MASKLNWLRLHEYVERLTGSGVTKSDAILQTTKTISRGRILKSQRGDGALLRFPEQPDPLTLLAYNRHWLVNPVIDFERSTILAPYKTGRRYPRYELRPTVIEIAVESTRVATAQRPRFSPSKLNQRIDQYIAETEQPSQIGCIKYLRHAGKVFDRQDARR